MSSSLWRTQRPRFPLYIPDGRGRDYYIKFDNGGYWSTQFNIKKKPDYERSFYSNFHTLFHQAAPFKYWGNGHGRETYILQANGLFHDQKPLCAYKLTDFLRDGKSGSKFDCLRRKMFMSVSEKKYNNELRKFEKKLIKRLYTEPMNLKKILRKKKYEINVDDNNNNINGSYDMKKSFSDLAYRKKYQQANTDIFKANNNSKEDKYKEEKKNGNIIKEYNNINKSDYEKEFKKGFNTICNFHNRFDNKRNNLSIKINDENNIKFNHVNDKTFNKYFENDKTNLGINKPELKFTEPKVTNNHKMKVVFNFKKKQNGENFKIKNIK